MGKILYLSCHSILEFEEIQILHELGHEVFAAGAYADPAVCVDDMRPGLPQIPRNEELHEIWGRVCAAHPGEDARWHLTKEFVDKFDTIIVMHLPDWIKVNWEVFRDKRVIWRTIGQSVSSTEVAMASYRNQGMEIVRYSPREERIPNFCGSDGLIRFYKDPEIYKDWNGKEGSVITFAQDMQGRGTACNYDLFERVTRPFPRKLFGPGNTQPGLGRGKVSFEQLLKEMRDNRVYFYTGTHPASYTLNFIEAWMTGAPVIAVGSHYGNANHLRNHDLYEIPDLIQDGVNGFVSDSPERLSELVKTLLNDSELAAKISRAGRAEAIKHFGRDMIKASWDRYLG